MSENRFLKLVNKTLTDRSTEIEIEGSKFLVTSPLRSTWKELQLEAKVTAEKIRSFISDTSPAGKLPPEVIAWREAANIDIQTKQDVAVVLEFGEQFTKLMVAECVRYDDGSKLWSTIEERDAVVDAIFEMPETLEEIVGIIKSSYEKKTPSTFSNRKPKTSSRKSSKGSE